MGVCTRECAPYQAAQGVPGTQAFRQAHPELVSWLVCFFRWGLDSFVSLSEPSVTRV